MRLLCLFFVLGLTACTFPNRHAPEMLKDVGPVEGTGLVLLSTGAPRACISTATFLLLKPAAEPYTGIDIAALNVDGAVVKSDFTDHVGYLHLLRLDAGDYYLAPWIANPYVRSRDVPKLEFSITGGEMIYLGEYFMPKACSLATAAEINNQMDRDVARLREKNPSVDVASLSIRLMKFSGFAVGGE